MKIMLAPKTNLGKLSVGLIVSFLIFIGLLFVLVSLGERGGDRFFSNIKLAIPGLAAGASGAAAFFTGIISISAKKERSVFVFLSVLIGFLY